MRLLLDTHIAIWAIADHPNLSVKARNLINDPDNAIVVSAATIWEIAIKHALARGSVNDMPISGDEALGFFREAGFEMLDISPAHAAAVETLTPLHGDPFDRLLVAQAMAVPLRLVTHDQKIAAYSDSIILV
ncbi:type II toxin-antitoxin system VapC family toxin [Acidisphaera sp. S103]|uniref:type II toxin-antitoxin system VapC family toxin n=1 Tax=Acidisphaera sp. S103 TaxID=1747223 RepID=UPI00131B05E2|nr:type II toxin-antitoxin system VapC family toxin [Acidisphaera sp. S103]